ncbi:MAG: DsbA family protein [Candidatus Nitrosopumilus sp. bin_6a]
MKNNFNLKNLVENNLRISIISGLIIVFVLGYFIGIESGQDIVRKQELEKLEQRMEELKTPEISLFFQISKDNDPILGDPKAPVSIIEFSNYQCQFCARFYSDTLPLLYSEYIETGKVNIIYRDFPIQKIYSNAMSTALASECANEQGKFWEYHDMLFETQNSWKQSKYDLLILTLKQFAKELNLNQEKFDSCLDSSKYAEEINQDIADGEKYLVLGTPTFFVGNEEMGYSSIFGGQTFSDFRIVIDEKLNQ